MIRTLAFTLLGLLFFSGGRGEEATEYTLLSYNIRYDNPADGLDAWNRRKLDVASVLAEGKAGVIGLQEVLFHQLEYLNGHLPNHAWFGVGRDDGEKKGEFNPVFVDTTRFSVLDHGTFWLSETPHTPSRSWSAACNRICTWVHVVSRLQSDTLLVLNTHFDHASGKAREQSTQFFCGGVRMIREGFEPLFPRCSHEVLMGDFNAQLYGGTHYNLGMCWDHPEFDCTLEGSEGTFNGFDVNLPPAKRIDYIYTRGMTGVRYQHLDPRTVEGRCVSDHLPVRAVVRRRK